MLAAARKQYVVATVTRTDTRTGSMATTDGIADGHEDGRQDRWVTYDQLAEFRRTSRASAVRQARRIQRLFSDLFRLENGALAFPEPRESSITVDYSAIDHDESGIAALASTDKV